MTARTPTMVTRHDNNNNNNNNNNNDFISIVLFHVKRAQLR